MAAEKMSLTEKFIHWCNADSESARFQRTIVQGIVGVVITYIPQIIAQAYLPEWVSGAIVAGIMCILAPIQAAIGKTENDLTQLNEGK